MDDKQRILELEKELGIMKKAFESRESNPLLKSLEDMTKNIGPQFEKLTKKMEHLKMMEPKRMDEIKLLGNKCSITITKGGVIVLNFDSEQLGDNYFDELLKNK